MTISVLFSHVCLCMFCSITSFLLGSKAVLKAIMHIHQAGSLFCHNQPSRRYCFLPVWSFQFVQWWVYLAPESKIGLSTDVNFMCLGLFRNLMSLGLLGGFFFMFFLVCLLLWILLLNSKAVCDPTFSLVFLALTRVCAQVLLAHNHKMYCNAAYMLWKQKGF